MKKRKLLAWYLKLNTREKIMSVSALIMTLILVVAVPVFAWFSHQRKMATMAKINAPAKISIKSGAKEDIIQFKMSEIDTGSGSTKDFVFCVEGEDISNYKIQLAHTTNINFTYTIYKAVTAETGVEYTMEDGTTKLYYRADTASLAGDFVNDSDDTTGTVTRTIGNADYKEPSYQSNTIRRQKYAEPLYWQSDTIVANDEHYDENTDETSFLNFYILRVSWGADVENDKETDLIYITAEVAS